MCTGKGVVTMTGYDTQTSRIPSEDAEGKGNEGH